MYGAVTPAQIDYTLKAVLCSAAIFLPLEDVCSSACSPPVFRGSRSTRSPTGPRAGYDALEVAAWPSGDDHPHHASHLEVDGRPIDTERICALLAGHGLVLSAVSCYENNLIGDPAERRRIHGHLKACIRAASALGVAHVGTFVGRDAARTVSDNLREAEKVLPELACSCRTWP